MTLQDLGSIGEIVAAIATILTLAYLAAQIRQNTRQARLTTIREVISSLQDGFAPLYSEDNMRVWRLGQYHPDQLTENEQHAFSMLLERQVHNFQNIVYQYDSRVVDQELFDSIRKSFQVLLTTPGGINWWADRSANFTAATRKHLESSRKSI